MFKIHKECSKQSTTTIEVRNSNNENHPPEIPTERDQWKRKLDFLVACMGFSVGLGNVWRFPYLCYKNGGGAFLIPYFISVFCAGIPLFLLEVTLGQLTRRGVIAAWDICPLFRGLGCASTLINFMVNCYYNVILAWGLRYLFASFTSVLPWTQCGQWWNTERCRTGVYNSSADKWNASLDLKPQLLSSDPVTEFWENRVLGISKGIEYVGKIQWELALCLLTSWSLIFLCICRGIKTTGTVMYFTALSPYVFMMILLVRTAMLEGAGEGIRYYLQPDWTKLGDLTVWSDAGTQIFFSYALSLGALTALGSYNAFHHNSFRDCLLFAAINTFTSLLAGFVIFSTLGSMSYNSNIPIELVAESGPGLAFVIYPKALGTMPGAPFWSVCFFLMILLLGIDSMFGGVEGFVAAFADFVPIIHSSVKLRCLVVALVCVISYFIGLTMITNGGMYVFQLFDYYSGSRIILVVGFLECIVIGFLFGGRRYSRLLRFMYGFSLGWLPIIFWCIVTPIFTFVLFVCSAIAYEELTYRRAGQDVPYQFPSWSVKLGWMMASSSLVFIPIMMVVQIFRTKGTLMQRIKFLLKSKFSEDLEFRMMMEMENVENKEQPTGISINPTVPYYSDTNASQSNGLIETRL